MLIGVVTKKAPGLDGCGLGEKCVRSGKEVTGPGGLNLILPTVSNHQGLFPGQTWYLPQLTPLPPVSM